MRYLIFIILISSCCKQKTQDQINPIFGLWKSITPEPAIKCSLLIGNDYMMWSTQYVTSFNYKIEGDSVYEVFKDKSYIVQFGFKIKKDTLFIFPLIETNSFPQILIKD